MLASTVPAALKGICLPAAGIGILLHRAYLTVKNLKGQILLSQFPETRHPHTMHRFPLGIPRSSTPPELHLNIDAYSTSGLQTFSSFIISFSTRFHENRWSNLLNNLQRDNQSLKMMKKPIRLNYLILLLTLNGSDCSLIKKS